VVNYEGGKNLRNPTNEGSKGKRRRKKIAASPVHCGVFRDGREVKPIHAGRKFEQRESKKTEEEKPEIALVLA